MDNQDIEFNSSERNRDLALKLVQRAEHEILIASYDLDAQLYSNGEFTSAISAFLRGHRNTHLHVLVWKTAPAVKHGHRMIEQAQRLSSITIHEPDKVHADFIESFMVVDGVAYFRRPLADRFDGIGSMHAPIIARDLKERFNTMWERSTPCSEFRRLGI